MLVTVQCLEGDNNNHPMLPREVISGWVRGQLSEPYVLVGVLKRKQKREDSKKKKIDQSIEFPDQRIPVCTFSAVGESKRCRIQDGLH